MSATYRFNLVAERSDGKRVVIQQSAAVYNTPEEALLQAGMDAHMGAAPDPVDVIDGAHHGYEVTAYGDPVDEADEASVRAALKFDPEVIAGPEVITRAAEIVRARWIVHPDDVNDPATPAEGPKALVIAERGETIESAVEVASDAMLDEIRGLL